MVAASTRVRRSVATLFNQVCCDAFLGSVTRTEVTGSAKFRPPYRSAQAIRSKRAVGESCRLSQMAREFCGFDRNFSKRLVFAASKPGFFFVVGQKTKCTTSSATSPRTGKATDTADGIPTRLRSQMRAFQHSARYQRRTVVEHFSVDNGDPVDNHSVLRHVAESFA